MRTVVAATLFGLACPVVLAAAIVPAAQESRARRRAIEEGPRTETPVWSAEFRVAARDMITEADLPDSDRADSLTEMAAQVARMTGAPSLDGARMLIEVDVPDQYPGAPDDVQPTAAALLHGIMTESLSADATMRGAMTVSRHQSPTDHPTYAIRIIVTDIPGGDQT